MQWNNSRQIIQSIEQHQRTTQLLNELGQMYSRIMFVIYLVLPYTLSDLIKLSIAPNMNQYIRMTGIAIFVVILILVYFFNYICASITVRNKIAPKYLYSNFKRTDNMRISIKLKIEAFLTLLTTEFIGIYCLNMFKFTKMSFNEYFFTVSYAYILISDFDN